MSIALPLEPGPNQMTPFLVTARNEMIPATGIGPDQRINRMGSRYAVIFEYPPMAYAEAQSFADVDDETETVVARLIQPGLDIGMPGAPVVDGAGQSGSIIKLRGLTPQYLFRKNQWVPIIIAGQRFAYRVKAQATAGADGKVSLPLRTMLRKPPPDGATVEVADPKIEGFATVPEGAWAVGTDRLIYLSLTIRERE